MKLSIVIPTNRITYSAIARILEVATLDASKFEVIVRDNANDEHKRKLLAQVKSPTLTLLHVPNQGPMENSTQALRLATGDFVLYFADDDWISTAALRHLHDIGSLHAADESISLLTGSYLLELAAGSGHIRYSGIDSDDAVERLKGYFQANAPNVLYYSAVRRSVLTFCMELTQSLPIHFSFHDILMVLIYLALGKSVQVDRVLYHYDQTEWETKEGTLAKDRAWYVDAGLPIELDRLHWLICGLEGALMLNSRLLSDKGSYDRLQLCGLWFGGMFNRFKNWNRDSGWASNSTNEAAKRLKEKWVAGHEVNLHELLFDLCDVIEITNKQAAQKYFQFWSTL
jgi:glycosyltransferase involved in cell wall biosynthesis